MNIGNSVGWNSDISVGAKDGRFDNIRVDSNVDSKDIKGDGGRVE